MEDKWSEFAASPMNMTDPWTSETDTDIKLNLSLPNLHKNLTSEEYIASLGNINNLHER